MSVSTRGMFVGFPISLWHTSYHSNRTLPYLTSWRNRFVTYPGHIVIVVQPALSKFCIRVMVVISSPSMRLPAECFSDRRILSFEGWGLIFKFPVSVFPKLNRLNRHNTQIAVTTRPYHNAILHCLAKKKQENSNLGKEHTKNKSRTAIEPKAG